jgi:ABC-type uncharacterized transport system involved in gliding motility auxiliary subunit
VPGEVFSYIVAYPFWMRALPAAEHAITRSINSVFMPWASSIDTLPAIEGRTVTPLLATSEFAGRQVANFQIRPDVQLVYDPEDLTRYVVAVAVQGAVDGALEGTRAGRAVLNALDWLTQTDALLDIRSKQPTARPLVFESNLEMQAVKYVNLVGVPLAFVLLGAVRLLRRRRMTRRKYGE